MSAIPLEAEGYTGAMLQNVSGGGKSILYIVPLQDELDLSPLPPNAPEFALMPKASCKYCFAEISLQMLALHDRKCASHTRPDLEVNFFSRIWDIKFLKLTVYECLKLEICFNLIDDL